MTPLIFISTQANDTSIIPGLIVLTLFIIIIAAIWRTYQKAGKHGWAAIVPIYNIIVMLQIVKRPWWWVFFFFIPVLDIIFGVMVTYRYAIVFGKGIGYTVLLIFLPFVGYPLLAWGDATYHKNA